MGEHPYQLLPPLSAEEYAALKADIAEHGIRVPVDVDENGTVLDGHHRVVAALGVCRLWFPLSSTPRVAASRWNASAHASGPSCRRFRFTLNACSRLSASSSPATTRVGYGTPSSAAMAVSALAQEVGVAPRTARRRLRLADELLEHPDLAAKVDTGEMEMKRAHRVVTERRAWARQAATPPVEPTTDPDMRVEHCDFRDLEIAAGTVDAIITDPPYVRDWVHNWADLSAFARRALRPAGVLVVYSGHTTFTDAFDGLRQHLEYVWIGSLYMPGPNAWIRGHRMHSASKPILVFSNGSWRPDADRVYFDTFTSTKPEKDRHHWQQQLGPFVKLVDGWTRPGDLVVDPCVGGGTTAVACRQLGRRFVGCDLDPAAVATARHRLADGGGAS